MTQRTIIPLLAALASCVYAETANSTTSSVIDIVLPMLDSQTVMGSIVGVDATATSYFLTCPTSESSLDCGLGSGMEVVEGASVLEVHYTEGAIGTIDVSCAIASNTATCTTALTTLDLTISNTATVSSMVTSTGTDTVTDISSYIMPVTVTAGLEKLSASSTSVSASSTSVSTGGIPRITQNPVLVGAAAVAGGILLI